MVKGLIPDVGRNMLKFHIKGAVYIGEDRKTGRTENQGGKGRKGEIFSRESAFESG